MEKLMYNIMLSLMNRCNWDEIIRCTDQSKVHVITSTVIIRKKNITTWQDWLSQITKQVLYSGEWTKVTFLASYYLLWMATRRRMLFSMRRISRTKVLSGLFHLKGGEGGRLEKISDPPPTHFNFADPPPPPPPILDLY